MRAFRRRSRESDVADHVVVNQPDTQGGRSGILFFGVFLLTVSLTVSACSGPPPASSPLPDLHLPGVTKIPGIAELEKQVNIHDILSMTTYVPSDNAGRGARVLFGLGGTSYDVGLNGGDLHALGGVCDLPDSVSPDGHWVLCSSIEGIRMDDLRPSGEKGTVLLPRTGSAGFSGPAWAPDGRQLAVLTRIPQPCTVAIYAVAPEHASAVRISQLTLPQFATSGPAGAGCEVEDLAWSPDGAWLSFAVIAARSTAYAVP